MNYQGKMFNDKNEFFINDLRSEMTNKRIKSEQLKLQRVLLFEVEEQLENWCPSKK